MPSSADTFSTLGTYRIPLTLPRQEALDWQTNMFKIGDFAKMTQVSVKTLRYYDEIGLFRPAHVDTFTEYRYYSADQLPRLNRILALKDLGLSLEQVAHVLRDGVSAEQIRGMLKLKRSELETQARALREQLGRVDARIQLIETEGLVSAKSDVVIKKIDSLWVAAAEDHVPNYENLGPVFDRLFGLACGHAERVSRISGPGIALYFDDGSGTDVRIEAAAPVAGPIPAGDGVKVYELAGVPTMACLIHRGAFDSISQSYQAITRWIEANGYRVCGPSREVYLDMTGAPASWITEIQFPVERNERP